MFNESDAVELQLGLTLQQIIDVVRFMYSFVAPLLLENVTLGEKYWRDRYQRFFLFF